MKHWPLKYRKYKGCFGYKNDGHSKEAKTYCKLGKYLGLYKDDYAQSLVHETSIVMGNPEYVLDFRKVERISLRGGLFLKAFFDNFTAIYGFFPKIRPPVMRKSKAVLQFLGLADYGLDCSEYPDLVCWQIRSWDEHEMKKENIARLLKEIGRAHV